MSVRNIKINSLGSLLLRYLNPEGLSVGLAILMLVLVLLMATIGPLFVGSPTAPNLSAILSPPGWDHVFGTDELGRDLLSRIVHGSRATLMAGVAAVLIGSVLGTSLGLVAGYVGGWFDSLLMMLNDLLLSFPYFLLVVVIVAALGPSLSSAMIAIGIWTAPYYARVIRANTMELRGRGFVEAAKLSGETQLSVVARYIFPNCISQVIVLSTTYMAQAILMAASLGFLGLGAQPPAPEWGAMTAVGRTYLFQAPHLLAVPAIWIVLVALTFSYLGDVLRDKLDPKSKRTGD